MHKSKYIKYLLLVVTIIALSWALPLLWKTVTDEPGSSTFAYYSSVNQSFGIIAQENGESIRKDSKGNVYTNEEFDSIIPMLYYRQLTLDGRLPDTLNNTALSPQYIRNNSFFYRYRPRNAFTPKIKLYTLFESMSGKVDLEMPGDVFRTTREGIEFIAPVSNQLIEKKTADFNQIFEKLGYCGPAKLVAGNPTVRKPYDEGNFIIDQKNQLFHLKMVNGKPFIRKKELGDIEIIHFEPTEYPDKRFYGFAFDANNQVYYLSSSTYDLVKIPTPDFDVTQNSLRIMGNPFYWTIEVSQNLQQKIVATNAQSLEIVDSITFHHSENVHKRQEKIIFPFTLSFISSKHQYIKPHIETGNYRFWALNITLMILLIVFSKIIKRKPLILSLLTVFLTGIYGLLATIILGSVYKNK